MGNLKSKRKNSTSGIDYVICLFYLLTKVREHICKKKNRWKPR